MRFFQTLYQLHGEKNSVPEPIVACPPPSLYLQGIPAPIIIPPRPPIAHSPSNQIFAVEDSPVPLLVKTAIPDPPSNVEALIRERAMLTVLSGKEIGIPQLYPISVDTAVNSCLVRTMVVTNEGRIPLVYATASRDPSVVRTSDPARIVAALMKIIWRLHSEGVIHGDVHLNNFVYADPATAAETLRLIDFGRAEFYIDKSGRHIPNLPVPRDWQWRPDLLSPWELEGATKSRRDDFFRIAEMAIEIAVHDAQHIALVNEINGRGMGARATWAALAKAKRGRIFGPNVPKVYRTLYQYALALEFDEAPAYADWIRILRQHFVHPGH